MAREDSTIQIVWKPTTEEERNAFLFFLRSNSFPLPDRHERHLLRYARLEFYPRLAFCEITDPGTSVVRYVLVDPDSNLDSSWFQLDNNNDIIYNINKVYLNLNNHNVVSYICFFFSIVSGPYGLMPILERLQSAPLDGLDDKTRAALTVLRETALPPQVLSFEYNTFQICAAMMFKGSIFKVLLTVSSEGQVEVREHELILSLDRGNNQEGGDDGAVEDEKAKAR